MTAIWLAGAENPAHHSLFRLAECDRVAINIGSYRRNYSKDWSLRDGYSPAEWLAWSDSPASLDDLLAVTDAVGKPPVAAVGPPEWSDHPNYMPIWNGDETMPMGEVGGGFVVTDNVFKDTQLNKRVLSSRKRDMRLGVITGSSKNLDRYDFVITSAWWSVQKHGETQLWDGEHMHRVNASGKTEFRRKHAEAIAALGVNEWDVLDDDSTTVAVLALRSWDAYGDHLESLNLKSEAASSSDNDSVVRGSTAQALDTTPTRGRHVLPTMSVIEHHDSESGNRSISVGSTADSLKRCDNCYLAPSCPAFEAGATCAYSIPVEIRTKDQLQKVMQAMLEIQTQRVFQNRFAEEITGQELDPVVGKEMDRLFALTEKMRDIMDNRDSVSINIESKGGDGGGVLSRLFGNQVGQAAAQLDQPVDADEVIESIES